MVSRGRIRVGVRRTENLSRDRRKLTFYFIAEKRIDFRELVRELFRYVQLPLSRHVQY